MVIITVSSIASGTSVTGFLIGEWELQETSTQDFFEDVTNQTIIQDTLANSELVLTSFPNNHRLNIDTVLLDDNTFNTRVLRQDKCKGIVDTQASGNVTWEESHEKAWIGVGCLIEGGFDPSKTCYTFTCAYLNVTSTTPINTMSVLKAQYLDENITSDDASIAAIDRLGFGHSNAFYIRDNRTNARLYYNKPSWYEGDFFTRMLGFLVTGDIATSVLPPNIESADVSLTLTNPGVFSDAISFWFALKDDARFVDSGISTLIPGFYLFSWLFFFMEFIVLSIVFIIIALMGLSTISAVAGFAGGQRR